MESNIKIKASVAEMNKFFDSNKVCSVRYFNQIKSGLFEARIRHAERKEYLYGTYTIPQIIAELNSEKGVLLYGDQ